jgi:exosortase/archaeosortase family protein
MSEKLYTHRRFGILISNRIYRSAWIFIAATAIFWLLLHSLLVNACLIDPLALSLARLVSSSLQAVGEPVFQVGAVIVSPAINMEITPACTGLYQIMVLSAGILAWSAPLRKQVFGIVFAALIIMSINTIRIFSIYYSALIISHWVAFIHGVLWEVIMIFLIPLTWLYWVRTISAGNTKSC